jgi:phosphodiesterase/alkaline phosphatase D-like protein
LSSPCIASDRRKFLASSATGALALSGGLAMPAIVRAAERPQVSHGLQAGDVDATSAMVWALLIKIVNPAVVALVLSIEH